MRRKDPRFKDKAIIRGRPVKLAIILLMVMFSVGCSSALFYPTVGLPFVSYHIITDKDVYEYGDVMKIDLVLSNDGALPVTIYFNGYGGDQYELEIGEVYTPTTNALSHNILSSITLKPFETKTFHHEWNLFRYSKGGCTGPRFGDLVAPGNHTLVSYLNLDAASHPGVEVKGERTITIKDLKSEPMNANLTVEEIAIGQKDPYVNTEFSNGWLRVEYYNPYCMYSPDANYTVNATAFKNGFLHLYFDYHMTASHFYRNYNKYVLLVVKIPVNATVFTKIGVYDTRYFGWGTPPQMADVTGG